ncbi:hypothetical protein AMTR_s00070p00090950 [Amborella trichopoda]|uniref:Uncharacterized protein n=1 Tax=Amborella trichopoda TaxID=13333 RepID=U5DJ31_AMBTC|nr:hypothetical protein AMTR_s00070p00090950 [Amborella trichopoda]
MDPWIEDWRDRAARVIEEEDEGKLLLMYEERYRAALRVFATLLDHGEESSEGVDQSSYEESVLLRARYEEVVCAYRSLESEHEEALHLRFSALGDLECLLWELDEVVREVVIADRDSPRDELDDTRVEQEGVRRTLRVECDALRDELERTRLELKGVWTTPASSSTIPQLDALASRGHKRYIEASQDPRQHLSKADIFYNFSLNFHEAQEDMKSPLHRSTVLKGMLIEAGNDPSLAGAAKKKRELHLSPAPSRSQSLAPSQSVESSRQVRPRLT